MGDLQVLQKRNAATSDWMYCFQQSPEELGRLLMQQCSVPSFASFYRKFAERLAFGHFTAQGIGRIFCQTLSEKSCCPTLENYLAVVDHSSLIFSCLLEDPLERKLAEFEVEALMIVGQ